MDMDGSIVMLCNIFITFIIYILLITNSVEYHQKSSQFLSSDYNIYFFLFRFTLNLNASAAANVFKSIFRCVFEVGFVVECH